MNFDLGQCDRFIRFSRDQAKRLRTEHGHKSWAQQQADMFEAMEKFLLEVRRDHQMRGPTGERLDAPALAAVPELKGKNAVVLYFQTPEDRDDIVEAIRQEKPGMRAVNLRD